MSFQFNAKLVLAAGSLAGLEAPLMPGYYMIGRHTECQIRPKSKSVSRRHCLVHHQGSGIRVFDLDSTSGTTINDEKIATKCWVDLNDGDLLRLGKIGFRLDVAQIKHDESTDSKPTESIVSGEAWDTFDIAGFLDSADEADRVKRYEKIRNEHKKASDSDVLEGKTFDSTSSSSGFITDDIVGDDFQSSPTLLPTDKPATTRTKSLQSRKVQAAKAKPRDSRLVSTLSGMAAAMTSDGEEADKQKLILAIVLALAVLGFAAHKAYQFTSGPPVRVLNEIDSQVEIGATTALDAGGPQGTDLP